MKRRTAIKAGIGTALCSIIPFKLGALPTPEVGHLKLSTTYIGIAQLDEYKYMVDTFIKENYNEHDQNCRGLDMLKCEKFGNKHLQLYQWSYRGTFVYCMSTRSLNIMRVNQSLQEIADETIPTIVTNTCSVHVDYILTKWEEKLLKNPYPNLTIERTRPNLNKRK